MGRWPSIDRRWAVKADRDWTTTEGRPMDSLPFQMRGAFAVPTTIVQPRAGDYFYLCNDYEKVRAAIAEGRPFEAHKVIGMQPNPVTINPAHIITAEPVQD